MNDTIAALATPVGMSGVGVIRLSGAKALSTAQKLWRPNAHLKLEPRRLELVWLYDGDDKLDQAFIIYMPSPHSYTGEDVVELQTHGSPIVLDRILTLLILSGARLAEPGEFTKRAYLNGKIDIAQAEAVNDVIHAQSLAAARAATDQLAGSLSLSIETITNQLLAIFAAETAYLDFGDEDIVGQTNKQLASQLKKIENQLKQLLDSQAEAKLLREGVKVSLIGLPNAGKSTLLNTLVKYDRAIVTNIAGTTRDHIEETIIVNNIPVRLIDTAGLTDTNDEVEGIGVTKSHQLVENSDVILLLIAPHMAEQTYQYLEANKLLQSCHKSNTIIVQTMDDLGTSPDIKKVFIGYKKIIISAHKNTGITKLKDQIATMIAHTKAHESATISALRHVQLLQKALQNIDSAIALIMTNTSRDVVLVAIDEAITNLNEIASRDIDQQKIDTMFANFCIGK